MIDIQQFADNHRFKTRVDDCGEKIIPGKVGHIYEYEDEMFGVIVMPNPPRKQYWGFTKRTLLEGGFQIVQDGDGEGCAIFNALDEKQVKLAKRAAGIKSRKVLSPEDSARRAEHARTLSRKAPCSSGAAARGKNE